ncbi:bile acid:sodium symporter family protein [Aquirufa aurantiipilula]|uniref:Bile acid:sodium symporter family protein n=1 Tax=Aquirufa aurantiipilula TaxID=2696561 RepID=A0ABT6BM28_9BACT|nr:bile acid:sodium symporter family protein [Aquirufa aurantiipilula]MBZ1325649.1 bile acid:sodium symporter family protein [Aquirufa aurantiipilula]MDF5691536.1 bile acid:sodium symporter family protein [Aquirufa aurantiipilula]
MQANFLSAVLLPLALAIIMMGLGLSLQLEDFKRVVTFPKAVVLGLFCQMILLPIICYFIALGFGLSPELAVGLMLLSASPGGPTANLYSHISKGDVALNVTLTALNSLISVFSITIIVNFAMKQFMQSDQYVPLQFSKVMEVVMIVLLPVSIGMVVRSNFPKLAAALDKPVKIASAIFLILVIVLTVIKEKSHIVDDFKAVGFATLTLNVASMAIGYFVPLFFQLGKKQAIAIGMEIGIHNGTLAIFIALTVIGNSTMSIPPVIYSLLMFFTAAIFGYLVNIGRKNA